MVGVAQLVEHLVVAQVAVGSSPITHPIKKLPGLCQARAILLFFTIKHFFTLIRYAVPHSQRLQTTGIHM